MDEDNEDILAIFALIAVLILFISIPLTIALSITSCIAYSRTKAWDKERNLKLANLESSDPLVDPSSNDSDSDLDTDDEDELKARKAIKLEEAADGHLTFNQKWRKEFKKVWSGKGAQETVRQKEREERKKMAKAIAKELDRRERRRARAAERKGLGDELPAYRKE